MKKLFFLLGLVMVMTLIVNGGYAQTRKSHGATGAVVGGVAGAGVGAAVSHDRKKGAIIGGVVGAGTGYAIGHKKKYPRKRVYRKK